MTIGLLMRCDKAELPVEPDWKPEPLGVREKVILAVRQEIGRDGKECRTESGEQVFRFTHDSAESHLEIDVPSEEEVASIAVHGIFAEDARRILRSLCASLHARYFDSESGFAPL